MPYDQLARSSARATGLSECGPHIPGSRLLEMWKRGAGSNALPLYSIGRTKLIENLQSSKPLRAFPRNRQTLSQGPSALLLSSQRVPAPLGRRLWTHPPVRARPCRSAFASVLECDGADLSPHIAFGQSCRPPIREPC